MLWLAIALAEEPGADAAGEVLVSTDDVWVRVEADEKSERIGRLAAGWPFRITDRAKGRKKGCQQWGAVDPVGWACLDWSAPTEREVADLPVLLDYQPPDPADFDAYLADGTFSRPDGEPILPFVYGRVWKQWKAPLYASAEAFAAGEGPVGQLPVGRRARFVGATETPRGVVLLRDDGTVVPEAEIYVFPITRFQGRDLRDDPVPAGHVPAWAVEYDGLDAAGPDGSAVTMPYHTPLSAQAEPVDGEWVATVADLEVHVPVTAQLRVWRPAERPAEAGDSELWLDLDTRQQVLGVLEGDTLIYATLVSTGLWSTPTPSGTFRITDKAAWGDMRSRPGAADAYYVEAVPWVLHFKARYALHGAYWHWGFGHRASHGCVNLAPSDAQWLYERIQPDAPPGWHAVWETDANPGTLLRVR
ncbi:MAG: L,D-transpeptidase [Alphaproteobacteria bacterium]|nr:L,D-transpeptidase [Alphaproteobacteria bacterium]